MVKTDYIGVRFGRLLIISESEKAITKSGNSYRRVLCKCDCGVIKIITLSLIKQSYTKSCGCLAKETRTKHGLSKHPLFIVWFGMKERCNNQNHHGYRWYGLKGISVCDEWENNFKLFYDWCILNGWDKGLQIDRKKSDKGYSPSNCRIVTKQENLKNRVYDNNRRRAR